MKEKYDVLKMEVISFEEGIWTGQGTGVSLIGAASGRNGRQVPAGSITDIQG